MRIIFLNTWKGTQKEQIRKFLEEEKHNTDIFCFQEVEDYFPVVADESLNSFTRILTTKEATLEQIYVNATYTKNHIEILESDAVLHTEKEMGLGLYTKIKVGNTILNIINVHGVPYPGDKKDTEERLKQTKELIKFTKNFKEGTIIGGDFNLDKDIKSVKMFESYQFNNLIEEFGIETTRNEVSWSQYPSKQFFADFVFTKNVAIKKFEVPDSDVSDHLAMILEI